MANKPGNGWATPSLSVFQLGRGRTLAVPMEVHAAARKKLVGMFHAQGIREGIVLMQGGEDQNQYDTDTELVFRQDSWFNYLFGVKEAGMYGAISLDTGKTTLFIPRLPEEYSIWCGKIHPPSHFQASYGVDEVLYAEDVTTFVMNALMNNDAARIHLMFGVNSDSGTAAKAAQFPDMESFKERGKIELGVLYNTLSKCRLTKSAYEVEVMRYAAWVGSMAHAAVMRHTKEATTEYDFEAKFLYEIYKQGGCRRSAYTCICACGPNGAVLHYGHAGAPNDRTLLPGDMCLLDMGAEYHGYVSDITCTFPMSGRYSEDQRVIYEGVLNAQRAVFAMMRPGVAWPECHLAAERQIIVALEKAGILHNGDTDTYVANELGPVFFPHGLGHLIGCDTHDVGGYLPDAPPKQTNRGGLAKLRTSRHLEEGMVLTNEPGCYFIETLINNALADPKKSQYINVAVLDRFRSFGGVRLEDVVLVTADGCESLSTCPRTVEEVQAVIAGEAWPPAKDAAPELKRRWTKLGADGKMEFLSL